MRGQITFQGQNEESVIDLHPEPLIKRGHKLEKRQKIEK